MQVCSSLWKQIHCFIIRNHVFLQILDFAYFYRVMSLFRIYVLLFSLLPYTLHTSIVKLCIYNKKNMLTASYVLPDMKTLEPK